jgi:hypothetical protein
MPPETVQIGPWLVSKTLVDALAPLLGVLVGGLITYIATYGSRHSSWR